MPPPSSRMTKNRAQPTRYRPGKAETHDDLSEEDESDDDGKEDEDAFAAKVPPPKASSFPSQKKLAVDLSKVVQQRTVTVPAARSKKPPDDLEGFVTASESSEDEDEDQSADGGEGSSEDSEEESSSEEEDSSDDEPKKPMLRPTFIPKAKRAQMATDSGPSAAEKEIEEDRLRKEKADELLQAHIDREAAARAAGKKNWDDEDITPEDEVDDTDDIDPEAEHAEWKVRELKRVQRERLAIEEKEKEREEIERRRNMTEEERAAEDAAHISAQQEEREGRGKMGYMQKYVHKGAFFSTDEQDDDVKRALNRDLAGVRFGDETGDKSVLPEYMRIRDMTRLGRKGRTKYKDLRSEDTGTWGQSERRRRDNDGIDERFRADSNFDRGQERTGANNAPLGDRKRREDGNQRGGYEKRPRFD